MKKIFALILATVMLAGVAAPSFAATASNDCSFVDKTLCVSQSLSEINND